MWFGCVVEYSNNVVRIRVEYICCFQSDFIVCGLVWLNTQNL